LLSLLQRLSALQNGKSENFEIDMFHSSIIKY
jgi:hypothetical protein